MSGEHGCALGFIVPVTAQTTCNWQSNLSQILLRSNSPLSKRFRSCLVPRNCRCSAHFRQCSISLETNQQCIGFLRAKPDRCCTAGLGLALQALPWLFGLYELKRPHEARTSGTIAQAGQECLAASLQSRLWSRGLWQPKVYFGESERYQHDPEAGHFSSSKWLSEELNLSSTERKFLQDFHALLFLPHRKPSEKECITFLKYSSAGSESVM